MSHQSIRFVVGRLRGARREAIQAVLLSTREWSALDARAWLDHNGFKLGSLDKDSGWWRARQRERADFDAKTLRAVDIGTRRETITVASNPKRGRKRRKVKGGRRRHVRAAPSPARRRRRRRPARQRARARGKTTRTTVKSVKVVRTNPKRKKRRVRRVRRTRAGRRFTLAFAPRAARTFARIARLPKSRRREMLRALRAHPSGGLYVAAPGWHGSRAQATRLRGRVSMVLAFAAGRRRRPSVPRVVTVP